MPRSVMASLAGLSGGCFTKQSPNSPAEVCPSGDALRPRILRRRQEGYVLRV